MYRNTGSPHLMSFKDFVLQQEDDIIEEEAVRRYQEYKVEFKRTQINDFFVLKKKEEWYVLFSPILASILFIFIIIGRKKSVVLTFEASCKVATLLCVFLGAWDLM